MQHLVAALCCLFFISGLGPIQSEGADHPNVLFIAVDDLGNVLGRTQPGLLKTPHLDRLMAEGTFFERAYCQIPLCNPSRASVLTGQRPDATTVYDLDRHFREQLPEVTTLPQLFREHRYRVARVGKIYHYDVPRGIGTNGLDDDRSWDEVFNPKGRDVADEALITNPTPQKAVSAAMCWLAADGTDQEQTDGMIATQAVHWLTQHHKAPFFLAVGFFRPHTPYVAPKKYFEMYPLEHVVLPEVPPGDRDDIPAAAIPHNIPLPDYGLPQETLRESLRAYYACVSFVDAQVGRVLEALDRLELADNTIVVFWSDHGYHLGEHHLWQKRTLFEESAKAPIIIRWPGAASRGKACSRIVEFVDLYPTVADLAGLSIPDDLPGTSLRPLMNNPEAPWDRPAFTQILRPGTDGPDTMGRVITTSRYRYVEWSGGEQGRELYDHKVDPHEIHNLANDPSHQDQVQEFHTLFPNSVRSSAPDTPVNPKRL